MKEKKRRLEFWCFYDRRGIGKHLEKMAAKGWMIERISKLGWVYRRTEPRRVHIAVTYYPNASEFDPEPDESQREFWDYCAHTGWELVCQWAQMQIFCNERENPTPIETDPATEVETLHRAMKRNFLPVYGILLLLAAMEGAVLWGRLRKDPIGFLSDVSLLTSGSIFLLLFLLCAVEIAAYLIWHGRAKKAAEQGMYLETPEMGIFERCVTAATAAIFAVWIFCSIIKGNGLMRGVSLAMFGYMAALILLVNGFQQFLKRKKVSRETNRTLTIAASFALAFAMMGTITYIFVRFGHSLFERDVETYEYNGTSFRLYREELPLRLEDLTEGEYDGFIRGKEENESFLLDVLSASHRPRLDAENFAKLPDLRYTVVRVKWPFLYELCRRELIEEDDELDDPKVPEGFKQFYAVTKAGPWGAEAAYRLTDQNLGPLNEYLLCYETRLVQIRLDWEPDEAQMAAVGEKLGGVSGGFAQDGSSGG